MHWWPIYAGLTALTVLLSWKRSEDARAASYVLVVTWLITNLSHNFMPGQYNQIFPIMDFLFACALTWVWRYRMSPWKTVLILLFVADMIAHSVYFRRGDVSRSSAYAYDLALNLMYLGQLACVALGDRRLPRVMR